MKISRLYLIMAIILSGVLITSCAGGTGVANSWPGVTIDQESKTVYLAYGSHVYAVNLENGTERWRFPTKADAKITFFAPPVVTDDGQVIVGGYNNILYGLDAETGGQKWAFDQAKNHYIASPLVTSDGIYAPSNDNTLYALNLAGNLRWQFKTEHGQWGTPAQAGTLILLPSLDHYIYALNAENGSLVWKSEDLGGSVVGTPTVSEQGVLYVGTFKSEMLALDSKDGKTLWRVPAMGWVWSGPALVNDVLYFGDLGGTLSALNAANGSILYQVKPAADTPRKIVGQPLIVEDALFFVADDGNLYAVEAANGNPRWNKPFQAKLYSGPYGAGDTILIAPVGIDDLLIALDLNGNQKWSFIPAK